MKAREGVEKMQADKKQVKIMKVDKDVKDGYELSKQFEDKIKELEHRLSYLSRNLFKAGDDDREEIEA